MVNVMVTGSGNPLGSMSRNLKVPESLSVVVDLITATVGVVLQVIDLWDTVSSSQGDEVEVLRGDRGVAWIVGSGLRSVTGPAFRDPDVGELRPGDREVAMLMLNVLS
jgi:hypothetical protein